MAMGNNMKKGSHVHSGRKFIQFSNGIFEYTQMFHITRKSKFSIYVTKNFQLRGGVLF